MKGNSAEIEFPKPGLNPWTAENSLSDTCGGDPSHGIEFMTDYNVFALMSK